MRVHYISPFSCEKNIGKAINDAIQVLHIPSTDWLVLTDMDAMWLLPDSKAQVERILATTPYDVLGCMTNRIRSREQLVGGVFNEDDRIREHIKIAETCRANAGDMVKECYSGVVAAFCMCFRASVWEKVGGFEEGTITFDSVFCRRARELGYKIGIMSGVYVWHSYRLMSSNPKNEIKRLFQVLDELNQLDEQTGSAFCGVCNEVVAVNKNGHNGTVTIGVPGEIAQVLALGQGDKRVMLVIVDGPAYDKIKNEI